MTYKDAERLSREARSDANLGMTNRIAGRKVPKHVLFSSAVFSVAIGVVMVAALVAFGRTSPEAQQLVNHWGAAARGFLPYVLILTAVLLGLAYLRRYRAH